VRSLVFIIFFSIDVTVKAASLAHLKEPVEEPRHCLAKNAVCAIGTYPDSKYELDLGPIHLFLSSDTNLTRLQRNRYILLKGEVWVKAEDEVVFESEYGNISVNRGNAFVAREGKKLVVRNLNAIVEVNPKGTKTFEVERGFENSLSPVDKTGHSASGIPQLIDLNSSLTKLGQLYVGAKLEFKMFAEELFYDWSSVVDKASKLHADIAMRAVAADNQAAESEFRRRQAFEAERQRLRRLFKSKTLEY
jgi:hypothetical protein